MGRFSLMLILAMSGAAYAESPMRLSVEPSTVREETPRSGHPVRLRIDLSRLALPRSAMFEPISTPSEHGLDVLELRDNVSREWAADRDFELAAIWGALSVAINHHILDRNWTEAQISATWTREL